MKQLFTCVHCGASLSEGAETCPVCGKRQLPPSRITTPTGRRRLAMRLLAALSLLLIAAAVILRLVC